MGIVRESISFQRGLSDDQIRDVLLGRWHKGQILGTDINQQFHNAWNVWLYMFIGPHKDDPDESDVLYIGRIQVRGGKAHIDPYYHNHNGKIESQWGNPNGTFGLRELTLKEKQQVQDALENPKYKKHYEEILKITGGITPKL
jgi:hypothetical protein